MNQKEQIRRCFVIGPMQDMDRLNILAREIIRPILEPFGFRIVTPDEGSIGTIMHQVLLNLEQADILVADLTGNNPNVMYELGVYHSFGKPSVIVKDNSSLNDIELTPFDIAAYRFIDISLDDVAGAIAAIRPTLERIIGVLGQRDWFPNPVTSFYDSPVAEIPTAVGLSKNYLKNFMGMILPLVFRKYEDSDDYQLKVRYKEDKEWKLIPNDLRDKLKVEILIPVRMMIANHSYISDLKERKLVAFQNAKVFRRTREFSMHIRFEEDGTPVLIDIPTIISTLNDSIKRRRGLKETQIDNSEWLLLESQELERFANKCELFRSRLENESPGLKGRVSIIWGWDIQESPMLSV